MVLTAQQVFCSNSLSELLNLHLAVMFLCDTPSYDQTENIILLSHLGNLAFLYGIYEHKKINANVQNALDGPQHIQYIQ